MKKPHTTLTTILALFVAAGSIAAAATVPATPAGLPVTPGEWHQSLSQVLQMANETGIPVVSFWTNPGCSHCTEIINQVINTPAFTAWRQARRLLLITGDGKTGLPGQVYDWTRNAATSDGDNNYPFLRVYWKQKDGTIRTDTRFSGYPYRASAQVMIDRIEREIAAFNHAGRASFATTPGLRLEPSSPPLPIPLKRELGSTGQLVNTIVFSRTREGGGTTNWTQTVTWSDGQLDQEIILPNEGHHVGGQITVTMQANGENDQVITIAMGAPLPITTHNPRFVGEAFDFAEWTMDIDAATNAVAAASGDAGTLVFFAGILWCPFCLGFERDILDSAAFLEFARTNRLALVVIDNPRRDDTPPTLLRYGVYNSTPQDSRNGNSGAAYLSGHGISVAAGEDVLQRNQALQNLWKLPGAERIGYPTLILLRKDGTIAGRLSGYSQLADASVTPADQYYDPQINMLRLHELLDMARDAGESGEEANNYKALTSARLAARDTRQASLRSVDLADFYRLETSTGLRQTITVHGPQAAMATLSLHRLAADAQQSAPGNLATGLTMSFTVADSAAHFVALTAGDPLFGISNAASTVRSYTIASDFEFVADETRHSLDIAQFAQGEVFSGNLLISAGTLYLLQATNCTLSVDTAALEALGANIYRALKNGATLLSATNVTATAALTWQLWLPGTIGFSAAAQTLPETAAAATIAVTRTGGGSGACSALVTLDASSSATAGADFTDIIGAGLTLTWADGDQSPKNIVIPLLDDLFYEGNEEIVLNLALVSGGAATGLVRHVTTIVDNDQPVIGELAIVSATPGMFKESPLRAVAPENSSVTLVVRRQVGAATAVAAVIETDAGTATPGRIEWSHNDPQMEKLITIALPALATVPRGGVLVRLRPEGGIPVARGRDSATIMVHAADAPRFAADAYEYSAQTTVAFEARQPIAQSAGGQLSVALLSGRLPAGLRASIDQASRELVISGVPTRAGQYSVACRVSERRGAQTVAGGVTTILLSVAQLADVSPPAAAAIKAEGALIETMATDRVAGILQFAATRNGRTSAKYITAKGNFTFRGKSWSAYSSGDGLVSLMENSYGQLRVTIADDGSMTAEINTPASAQPLRGTLAASPWSAAQSTDAYLGYYTIVMIPTQGLGSGLPRGYSFVTLNANAASARTGRATYAGRLADGTAISGSTALRRIENGNAALVMFSSKRQYAIAAMLTLMPYAGSVYREYPGIIVASAEAEPYWLTTSLAGDRLFDVALAVYGGFYVPTDDLTQLSSGYQGDGPMRLMAEPPAPQSAVIGTATALPLLDLAITPAAISLERNQENPTRASFSFNRKTAIFQGSLKLPFEMDGVTRTATARYAGVLLPGWTEENCGCDDAEVGLPFLPFGMGACWFSDSIPDPENGAWRRFNANFPLIIGQLFNEIDY